MGCYLSLDNASTIEDIVAAINKRNRGGALLVVGYFNTNPAAPEGRERDEGIAASISKEVLDVISSHFLPRHKLWLKDSCTWDMHPGSWEVRSRINYILGTDSCLLQNVAVRDARHNMDH